MPNLHDRGSTTNIGWGTNTAETTLSSEQYCLHRLRREHQRGRHRSSRERGLMVALGEIKRLTGALELSTAVTERASILFREAQEANLCKG